MALRLPAHLKSMLSRLKGGSSTFATSTTPKMKAYAPAADLPFHQDTKERLLKGDFVPVCVALGMIGMSMSLGIYTAMHELRWGPNVFVRKTKRETIPELVEPEHVLEESERYIKKSFFRKLAHVQEFDQQHVVPDPIRGDILARKPRAVTLKDVGVDPKPH